MRILVLLGTNPYSFIRLVNAVEKYLSSEHEVSIQLGSTKFKSENMELFQYTSRKRILEYIESSDLVIAQGGFGSIKDVLSKNKPLIAVPRMQEFGECLDNQLELVDSLASKNYILACLNVDELSSMVRKIVEGEVHLSRYNENEEILKISDVLRELFDSVLE